jgi:hypothetical protein
MRITTTTLTDSRVSGLADGEPVRGEPYVKRGSWYALFKELLQHRPIGQHAGDLGGTKGTGPISQRGDSYRLYTPFMACSMQLPWRTLQQRQPHMTGREHANLAVRESLVRAQ